MSILDTILAAVPDFAFAIALFYLCQNNADKQRQAYQEQLNKLYSMMERMLSSIEET